MKSNGWIGVDLDGTLARYDGWKGFEEAKAFIVEQEALAQVSKTIQNEVV